LWGTKNETYSLISDSNKLLVYPISSHFFKSPTSLWYIYGEQPSGFRPDSLNGPPEVKFSHCAPKVKNFKHVTDYYTLYTILYIYIYIELNQTLKSAITRYACSLTTGIYILTITDWYYYKRRPPARQYNGSDNLFAFATAIVVRGFIITRNQHSRAFRSRKW